METKLQFIRQKLKGKYDSMKRRCLNKNDIAFKRYGAKGITISSDWMSFKAFYRDMVPTYFKDASIDRIDNSKGYSKENCRWIKLADQQKNRRNVVLYELNGEKLCSTDWDRKLGLKDGAVRRRIKVSKYPIEKALTFKKYER